MRQTADYHFELPPELIAQSPADKRVGSRLLQVHEEEYTHRTFADISACLPENSVLIVNDTKVIRARLHTLKETGGAVELLLLEPQANPLQWKCLAKASKPIRDGCPLTIRGTAIQCHAVGGRGPDGSLIVEFPSDVFPLLEAYGELPLPPYIERGEGDTEADRNRYQTVYAREEGAVAAPTAGLHFDDAHIIKLYSFESDAAADFGDGGANRKC